MLTVQLSLQAGSKDWAFLLGIFFFFFRFKVERAHMPPSDVPVLLVKRQSGNSSRSI